jgi:hypothetical protein
MGNNSFVFVVLKTAAISKLLRALCFVLRTWNVKIKKTLNSGMQIFKEEGHGRLGNEAAGPSVLVLFPSRATLGIPIIPNLLVWVSE